MTILTIQKREVCQHDVQFHVRIDLESLARAAMQTEIVRLTPAELPEVGPVLVVAEMAAGETIAARYHTGCATARPLPTGQLLVAIIRSMPLSTPDQIDVTEVLASGHKFMISLHIHCYAGDLAANVVTIPLVQVVFGNLMPGAYEIVASEIITYFLDLSNPKDIIPDDTMPATTTSHELRFKVL